MMIGSILLLAAAVAFERPHVVPTPTDADWSLDQCVELKPDLPILLNIEDSSQREPSVRWLRSRAKAVFGVDWQVRAFLSVFGERRNAGGRYGLNVATGGISISA